MSTVDVVRFLFCTLCLVIVLIGKASASTETRAALEAKTVQFWGPELPPLTAVGHRFVDDSPIVAWGDIPGTVVTLNMPVWRMLDWPMKCTVWIHERGHNLGFDHAEIGVMRPVLSFPTKMCRRWHP